MIFVLFISIFDTCIRILHCNRNEIDIRGHTDEIEYFELLDDYDENDIKLLTYKI